MSINLVYITDKPEEFNLDRYENSGNWKHNCFGQNFFCVNTGDIISDKTVLASLPYNNMANANNHRYHCNQYAHVITNWWSSLQDIPLLKNLNSNFDFRTIYKTMALDSDSPYDTNFDNHPMIMDWALWMTALDIINIEQVEAQTTTILIKDLNLMPKDSATLHEELLQKFLKQDKGSEVGGGLYEVTPVNGLREVFVDPNGKFVIGHYHTLTAMFKLATFKQVWANVRLTLSTVNKLEEQNLYELVAKHLDIKIINEMRY